MDHEDKESKTYVVKVKKYDTGTPEEFLRWCLVLIPQVRPAHKYPISPWEMIHLPLGDNALCAPPYTVYTAVCNMSLTATYQYKTSNPSNKVLVNNNY
jgi:hypothetical protein